jgi:hypothetical protein
MRLTWWRMGGLDTELLHGFTELGLASTDRTGQKHRARLPSAP